MPDIAFLLIIFFMVTSVLLLKQGLITMLPKPYSKPLVLERKNIVRIQLFSDDHLVIDDHQHTLPELSKVLEQILLQNNKTVVLQIDSGCKYKHVVDAIGQIQSLGITRLSISKLKAKKNFKGKI